jgi:hypothetical protein
VTWLLQRSRFDSARRSGRHAVGTVGSLGAAPASHGTTAKYNRSHGLGIFRLLGLGIVDRRRKKVSGTEQQTQDR